MAFVSNSLDFPNLTVKTTPTSSDIVLISDAAASNALEQSTLGSLPLSTPAKAYVDEIGFKAPVIYVSVTNLAATYNNGALGVGATLTATTNIVLTIDGQNPIVGYRVLIAGQSTDLQNGIYSVTNVGLAGGGGHPWILTRTTDYNTAAQMVYGTVVFVTSGNVYFESFFTQASSVTNIGIDPIDYFQVTATLPVTVPNGGTGDVSFTAYSVICGGTTSTGNLQNVASVGTSNQLLASNGAGALPSMKSLAAGTGITISGLTISASGAGFTWSTVSGTTQTIAAANGYVANNAAVVTFTLPASAAVGDTFRIGGLGAGGWKIAQNASQLIHLGSSVTTTGTGGSLASSNQFDTIEVVCIVTNTTWTCLGPVGNIVVV